MNNREITEKKNEEKNFENSLQTHDKLKSYLINICVKIEKGFFIIFKYNIGKNKKILVFHY